MDTRDKLGRFVKGRIVSNLMKYKTGSAWRGKKKSEKWIMIMKKRMSGINNPNWKGGICRTSHGYQAKTDKKYIHRIVFEEYINRPLKKREIVHHIDKDRINNNISNLFLFRNLKAHLRFEFFQKRNNIIIPLKTNYQLYAIHN